LTKGDGRQYNITISAGSFMAIPASVSFVAGAEWQQHTFLFSEFGSIDTRELLGISFSAGGSAHGTFQFQIDDVQLIN